MRDRLFHLYVPKPFVQGICHRDLKLENLLLDGSKAPRLKICDFGYSKVAPPRAPPPPPTS